jgi:hypothetical protein
MRFPNDGSLIIDDATRPCGFIARKAGSSSAKTSSLRFHRAHTLSGEETNHQRATNARKEDEPDVVRVCKNPAQALALLALDDRLKPATLSTKERAQSA